MFTVKVRKIDGSESLYGGFDAVRFEFVGGSPTIQAWRGDQLSGLPMTFDGGNQPRSAGDHQPIAWIMNDQGATVAKYEL